MLEGRHFLLVKLSRPLFCELESHKEQRAADGDADDRRNEVDVAQLVLLAAERIVENLLQIGTRPVLERLAVKDLRVVFAVSRTRLHPRLIRRGVLSEVGEDECVEIAYAGKRLIAVRVEVVFVADHIVVDGDLDLGHDLLIRVDLLLKVTRHRAGHLRHDYCDDACAGGAQQTRYCQQVSAAESVVGHAGVEPPVRHVADRVHHAPYDVHDAHCRKTAGVLRIPRQETEYGDDGHRDGHPLQIRTAFSPRSARPVHDRAHDRIVQRVVYSREQHEQRDGERAVAYRVRHEHREI